MAEPAAAAVDLPRRNDLLFRWFSRVARRELRKGFAAVRVLRGHRFPGLDPGRPAIVYLNHPSWWDPLLCIEQTRSVQPDRRAYGPIDAEALRDYPLFRRLGFYGIERNSRAGSRRFLEVSLRICREPGTVLWMTPEGSFRDSTLRPVELTSGLARLVSRLEAHGLRPQVVPLALHYAFWNEKRPEVFLAYGAPLDGSERGSGSSEADWLRQPLESLLDELIEAVTNRDTERFERISTGRTGLHPVYDLMRRVGARLGGRRVPAGHESPVVGNTGDRTTIVPAPTTAARRT